MTDTDIAALRADLHRANQACACAFTADDFCNADVVTRRGLARLMNALPAVLDELAAARDELAKLRDALRLGSDLLVDAVSELDPCEQPRFYTAIQTLRGAE